MRSPKPCLLRSLLSPKFMDYIAIMSKNTHRPGTNVDSLADRRAKPAVRPGAVRFGSPTNTQLSTRPCLNYKRFAEPGPACSSGIHKPKGARV